MLRGLGFFEKLTFKRVYHFLEKHNILYQYQFGFRAKHSTSQALISMVENLKSAIDNGQYGCGLFIDLRKAFDTVNHSILLNKLHHYGIRGITNDWFKSYLSDRQQYVSINGHNSSCSNLICGVPQGSVLGPLLFLIYINDLPNTSSKLQFHLFADDTNVNFVSNDLDYIENCVNEELKSISKWLRANRLSLNVEKTNFVIFHSSRRKLDKHVILKLDDSRLTEAKSVKYLGILIDSNLTWKTHISELCKKLSRTVGILCKIRHYVPVNILILLYYSLLYSFMIYGIEVWGNTYISYLKPLIILQKKAIRIMTFKDPRSSSEPIFKSLSLLKFIDIVKCQTLRFVFQCKNNRTLPVFDNYFIPLENIHLYNTRQVTHNNIFVSKVNTEQYGKMSIKYRGTIWWNTLPTTIKSSGTLYSFKSKLKQYILETYRNE